MMMSCLCRFAHSTLLNNTALTLTTQLGISFSAPVPVSSVPRIWDSDYVPATDETIPIHFDLNTALLYFKGSLAQRCPSTIINAPTTQEAGSILEERMRASWRQHKSAQLFCGSVSVHMFVVFLFSHI